MMDSTVRKLRALDTESHLVQSVFGSAILWVALTALIIALVITPMVNRGYGPILPEIHGATPFSVVDSLTLAVTSRGDLVLNGTWVPEENFDWYVAAKLAEFSDGVVAIQVDRDVPYYRVRDAMKRLSNLGVERVFLVTDENGLGLVLSQAFLKPTKA
jgi:biopolymer transport protein ExbD